jgi:hypothetical protein
MDLQNSNLVNNNGDSPKQEDINEPDTLLATLEALKKKGFTYDFNLTAHALEAHQEDGVPIKLSPDDFTIVEVFRFEGMSNPSDGSILYAIESNDGINGTLVSSYGVYADSMSNEMIKKLDTRNAIIGFPSEDADQNKNSTK